jgi:DNA-binding transcriptional MerR regulator
MNDVSIGSLAAITGVKVPTIRFYEQNGLIAAPRRTEGGQRRYDADAVRRLYFIRHARDLGFDMKDIRQLLALSDRPATPCHTATDIARHHLRQVETKIARLRVIGSELKRMIEDCNEGCAADCRILEAISSDPTKSGYRKTRGLCGGRARKPKAPR